jgi:ferrous iron transport protein A
MTSQNMRLPGFLTNQPIAGAQHPGHGPVPVEGEGCRISLDSLSKGQCGVVWDLDLLGNDDKRLRTLGICPGRRVWLVRRGDPMVVRVMGSRLGLARELARRVTVEVCAPPCSVANDLTPEEIEQGTGA